MKKNLRKLFVLMALFSLPYFLCAQGYGVRLEEGFENGIPADWTQENVKGTINWVVNSGESTYPNGAFEGESRVEFKGNSNVTTKARTRLITPVMDIQGIYQPILIFAHAQSTWTDDFDTLKILYRASADKEWTELKVYDSAIKTWTRDTLRLIGGSKTYQIAFEASDNLGRGVVIDNVLVRSTPRCAEPQSLNVSNVLNESATIAWFNDGDAKTLSLKVSTVALTAEQLADESFKADVLDTLVAKNLYRYNLIGLTAGKKYYYYLRSNCGEDISGWASADFVTSNVIKPGYAMNFNNRSSGVTYPLNCYVGSSDNVVPPYINVSATSAIKNALSPDASTVVCFNAEVDHNAEKALPSSSYAYFALPQIELDENKTIADLYVSFVSMNYNPYNSERSSIIVGVMTDPVDYYSFEAIDTVDITSMRYFEECFVSLEKYQGEGKFIAFFSEFESSNIFVMDNLKVDYRPEVLKVNNFKMRLTSSIQVKFDFPFSYDKYEVVLAEKELTISELNAATPQVVNNGGALTVKPATHYYVYARGLKGANKGTWSDRRILHTVGQVNALPYNLVDVNREKPETFYSVSYENSDVQTGGVLTPNVISLGNSEAMFGVTDRYFTDKRWIFEAKVGKPNRKCWTVLVLPELSVDLETTRMSFEIEAPENNGIVVVGCMTDARDITTFKPLDTISAVKGYSYHYFDFVNYELEGKFIAMLVEQENGVSEVVNSIRLDKVKFLPMPSCGNVTNVEAVPSSDPTKVVISWDATNADAWVVCVSKSQFKHEGIDKVSKWYYKDTVTTNSVEISGLEAPGHKYYYTVSALCDGVSGEWTYPDYFETGCFDIQPIPYVENFDNLDQTAYSQTQGFKVPCMATQQVAISSGAGSAYYPQVQQEGNTYGVFMRRGDYTENKNLYLALPKMAEPINKLQISFDAILKAGLTAGISVGVMTNPYDSTTFEEVVAMTTIRRGEFVKFIATLDSYKGTGEYIAISLNDKCKYDEFLHVGVEILFDNIRVDYLNPCARPEDVTIDSYDSDRVKLRWRSPATVSKWRVLLADSRLTEAQLANITSNSSRVLKMEEVTTNPCTITGLPVNTDYFIYVQPLCDTVNGEWSDVVTFRTPCAVKPIGELEVEGFENYIAVNVPGSESLQIHPECWTVGTTNDDEHDAGLDIGNYIPHCVTPETTGFENTIYKGNSSLHIQTVKNFNGAYAISNKIGVDDISKLYMKLMGRYNGDLISGTSELSGSVIVGVVTEPTRLNTFIPVDTLSFVKGEYLPYEVYFDSYEGDQYGYKGQYVMFLADFGPEVKVNVCIDEVEFDTVSPCKTNLVIDSIGVESIRVKILGGNAPYQVKYSKSALSEDILNGNTVDSIVSDTNIFEIPNLTRVTTYYLSARSSCDSAYTDWAMIEKVETDWNRVISLPYFDDFEDQPNVKQTTPECWYSLYTGSAKYPYPYVYQASSTFYPSSGTHGIYMYLTTQGGGGTTYLVTPEIDVDSLSRCQVSFYECNGAANKRRNVIVGAVSDVNDIVGTFEPIDTIIFDSYPSLVFNNAIVPLDKYKGTAKHIAFTSCLDYCQKYSTKKGWIADASQLWFTIDDILIELIPTCFPGTDFKMVGHTDTSLEIEFTHEGAPQYEVKYGAVDFNVDTAGTSMIVDAVTHFTIENLTPNTEYDVHVRTICDDGEKSKWGYAGKYRTAPEALRTMPYSFNFNDSAEAAKWAFAQNGQTNQWFIGADDAKVVSDKGGNALYISNDNAKSAHYSPDVTSRAWASRTIALEAGVYTITYDWTCFGEANNDYIRVGFLPTTSRFTAGSATVVNLDGTSGSLGNLLTENRIQGWIDLSQSTGLNGVDTTKVMAEQWQTIEKVIIVTPEMAGLYNMVFYWVNNNTIGEYAAKRSAVIDNVNITRASCNPPHDLKLLSVNATEAKMAISSTVSNVSYEVVAFADTLANVTENNLAFRQQVNGNTVTINGLTADVNYKVYIRTICSEGNNSIWVGPFEVATSCNPIELNTVLTMDNENEHYSIGTSNGLIEVQKVLPNCFVAGHENANMVANYVPYLVKSTGSEKYSRSGDYALRLSTYTVNKESVAGDYVVLPLVNADFETSQVNFWMRCVTNDATGKVANIGVGDTYARKITVGTMTNPYDPTTFVAIGTYEYSYTVSDMGANITNDMSGNNYWIEVSVPLIGAEGDFVAFKNEGYGAVNNVVYIDDIEFAEISCFTPNSLKVSDITSNSASIDFNHSDAIKYLIQRADNVEFTNAHIDEVTSLPFKMENLEAMTNYYVKVQTICAEDTSNWSPYIMFTTDRTTPYAESFDRIVNNMNGWLTSNSCTANECFAGTALDCLAKLSADTWTTKGGISGSIINTMHLSTKVNNLSLLPDAAYGSKTWLISPVIDLVNTSADYHLLFDLALTDMDKNIAPTEEDKADKDDKFMVIISEDEGATWSRANATIWGTTADDYEYFSIPASGKRYEIDLTKYAGKQIKIAFYTEANKTGASTEIHLDNVHVNIYVEDIVEAPVCQTEGFENRFFTFDSEELTVGEKEVSYWELHVEADQVDTLRGVKLNILPMSETTLSAQMCEGDVYALNGFPSLTEAGRYKQKVRSANGCDSVIVLDLSIIPNQKVTITDTICSGQVYNWNGKEFTTSGVYIDTLPSSLGCDSIVTFILKVNDPIQTEEYVNICYGKSYTLGGQTITTSGDFKETFKTVDGCDSIVLLHATVLPDYRLTLNEVIKSGEKYSGNGFDGLSKTGIYTLKLESVDGCDSTIVLNLTVLDGDTTYVEFTITTDDLPYDYETIHYGEDTKPGVYVDTVTVVAEDGSEYVVVHTLTIEQGTAVDDVNNFDLIMVPNPLKANSTLFINADFTIEEREGLVVEIFNAVGQRIYLDTPSIYPIAVDGLNTTGVYVVRVITGNGKSYLDKVIVE